jgi:hypothetical protein
MADVRITEVLGGDVNVFVLCWENISLEKKQHEPEL